MTKPPSPTDAGRSVAPSEDDMRLSAGASTAAPSASVVLNDRQIEALRWIDINISTTSEWLHNGKPPKARVHPDKWNQLRISGPRGSIVIDLSDWQGIVRLVGPASPENGIHALRPEGLAAIGKASAPQGGK